jgi:putative addiction module component (TIGR02574 family)
MALAHVAIFLSLEFSVKVVRHIKSDLGCGKVKVSLLPGFVAHLRAGESGMSPEVSDLLKRALTLPADERAALANTLLDSLETTDQSVQEAWDAEVARRMEDLKAGKAVTVPWEQLHRELLALVNEP